MSKKNILFFIIIWLILQPFEPLNAAILTKVRICAVKGTVQTGTVVGGDYQGELFSCPLKQTMNQTECRVVNKATMVETGPDGWAVLEYFKGTTVPNLKVKIMPNTKIVVQGTNIFVHTGKSWFKVEYSGSTGQFIIRTPTAIAGIRGTEFLVEVENDGTSTCRLIEGELEISDINKQATMMLSAGMEVTIHAGSSTLTSALLNIKDNDKWWTDWPTLIPIAEMPPGISDIPDPQTNKPGKDIVRLEPVADSHVYAYSYLNWNKSNWGKYDRLAAGWHPTGGEKRAYIKFDLSGIELQGMNKAKLRLYHNHTAGAPILKLGVHQVTGRWAEGRGTYPGKTDFPSAPGEITWVAQPPFEKSTVASFSPGADMNKYVEVDVTELVKAWLFGEPNYGLVIIPMGTLGPGTRESGYGFYSREHEDKTKRPLLIFQSAGGIDTPDEDSVSPEPSAAAKEAYGQYISAYNKLTTLMAQGKGDTPEAQAAFEAYKEAKDIYEAILKAENAVPDVDKPKPPEKVADTGSGQMSVPAKTQKKQTQDKKQDEPSGTGPEYDCEYGLPRRDGANGEIQLTSSDLPAGLHLDDFANMNKACEVHQWIMQGPDRKNRIELNISVWNERADKYYNWKHGMLGTGQYNQTDLPVGNKQLYVEEKAGCNKQLIAQVGNYLVEMHRPPVEGLTQQTDPISRGQFVALAEACENRIEAVAGIPPKQMLNDNPSDFRWGTSVVWPVGFVNGTLKVQGAGRPTWGTDWVVVDTGIKSYRGQGTGAGPVVTYTKDNKRWTVVKLNHDTGGRGNVRVLDTRVSIIKVGAYGATLRIGGRCYDYSWNHLEEINCKTGKFIYASNTTKNAGVDDPGKDPKPPGVKVLPPVPVPTDFDYPDWVWNLELEVFAGNPPEVASKYSNIILGWIFDYDEFVPFKLVDRKTGQEFPAAFKPEKYQSPRKDCGTFNGQVFHATGQDTGSIKLTSMTISYVPKGGKKRKTMVINDEPFLYYRLSKSNRGTFWVHINPPLKVKAAGWPPDTSWAVFGHVYYKDSVKPIEGVRVVIQGENTPEIELGTTDSRGHFKGLTYKQLRAMNAPRGIYTVYAYKRDKDLSKDLWPDREYKIAIPPAKGETWELRIFMTEAGQWWKKK